MAIMVETLVPVASRADVDRLGDAVEASMVERGGPPQGLMAHFVSPFGGGFRICDVWANEASMQAFYDEVLLPQLAAAGLAHEKSVVSPVWSFARP